jgi:hypothetical protein
MHARNIHFSQYTGKKENVNSKPVKCKIFLNYIAFLNNLSG